MDLRANFIWGDCHDRRSLAEALHLHQIEAVVHFAASALVSESMRLPGKYFFNNTSGTQSVLDSCVVAGVRKLVLSSTCATYGVPETDRISESHPQRPVNPYGESKLLMERMLPWYQQAHGLEFVGLRYFNAAGATALQEEHHRIETHLIPNVIKVALGQSPRCEVFGEDYPTPDGTCVRDYIHVEDLAQAHLLALMSGKCGFFNLGNGSGHSIREVIRTCEQVSGCKIPALFKPRRAGDPPRLVAAADKAMQDLGWKPRLARLDQILASAWNWHRTHPHGYPD